MKDGILLKLVIFGLWQRKLRTLLTISGVFIALFSFVMIQTMINAWYAGVRQSARDRLVTRNAISLTSPLPLAHLGRIAQNPGVTRVGIANWFGGVYIDERNRFPQFAVDQNYLKNYPEFIFDESEFASFLQDKRGMVIGEMLSEQFKLKIGDTVQLKGTIYPGTWDFIVRAIFKGRDESVITKVMFFHWNYLNERIKSNGITSRMVNSVGVFVTQVADKYQPEKVSSEIDNTFKNSMAETLTESETAFQQSFLSMSSSIILALHAISIVVLVIILLVLANTLYMSSRERIHDYAILKSLGFQQWVVSSLILIESSLIVGSGLVLTYIVLNGVFSLPPKDILGPLVMFFPVFKLQPHLIIIAALLSILLSFLASLGPMWTIWRLPVTAIFRRIE
jgi:putative ABC transport system permease protein